MSLKAKADAHDTLAERLTQKYEEDTQRHEETMRGIKLIKENIAERDRKIKELEQEIARLREENEYRRMIAERDQEIKEVKQEITRLLENKIKELEQEVKDLKGKEAMRDAPRISARTRSQTNRCAA